MLYKIVQNGDVVCVTDKVTFTRKTEAGFFTECERADAQGFCLRNGDVWSLAGTDGYEGIPFANIEPVEEAELFAALDTAKRNRADIDFMAAMSDINLEV